MIKLVLRSTIILQYIFLYGCAPIYISDPYSWPHDFVQKDTLQSLIGSREENVLQELGLPAYIVRPISYVEHDDEHLYYVYERLESDVLVPTALFIPMPIPGTIEHQNLSNCVILSFDMNGKLLRYKMNQYTGQSNCAPALGKVTSMHVSTLIGIDIGAQEQYFHYLALSDNNPNRLSYLCRAADQGNPYAQLEVGKHFAEGRNGVQQDIKSAYVWYSLAVKFVPGYVSPTLQSRDKILLELAQEMTPDQIGRGEQMLKDWKPGQCEQILIH